MTGDLLISLVSESLHWVLMVNGGLMNCLILADIYNLKADFKLLGKSREYEKEKNVWTSEGKILAPNSEFHSH